VTHFFFEILFEVLILSQLFLMITLKVAAQFSEGLYQLIETLRVYHRLNLRGYRVNRFLGLIMVDRRRILEWFALRIRRLECRLLLGLFSRFFYGVALSGFFFLEEIIISFERQRGRTRKIGLFRLGRRERFEATLQLPVGYLLDIAHQIRGLLPLLQTTLVLRDSGSKQRDEGLVDEVDHEVTQLFQSY
jgi:hypothetical protein